MSARRDRGQPIRYSIYCNQCEALAINGVPCHEHGCPNAKQPWKYAHGNCYPENIELPQWRKELDHDDAT